MDLPFKVMELLDTHKGGMKEGTFIELCNGLMGLRTDNKKAPDIITIAMLVGNIQERMPPRRAYFYRNLGRIIRSAIEDNFDDLHLPVQFFVLSAYQGAQIKDSVYRAVIAELISDDSSIHLGKLYKYL
tara:strand:- start:764 stop:1150 length:387 start_codon:yes stop_codon:yes gene_type:complete